MKHNIYTEFQFLSKYISSSNEDIKKMLKSLNCSSIKELIYKTIPKDIVYNKYLNLPNPISEYQYLEHIKKIGKKNKLYKSYIGLGYKNTITPCVIQRNILENPNWYTSYTPYQPEISQGRLEALINFQTIVTSLTGMNISNASMLDESSAAADAMLMIYREKEKKLNKNSCFFISNNIFPHTISVLKTRCFGLKINFIEDDYNNIFNCKNEIFGIIISYPSCNGEIEDYSNLINYLKKKNISVIVTTDLLSLCLLKPPGEWGADVVVGTSQNLGVPIGYGGPHAAFYATHEKYKRFIPGRIVGISIDRTRKKVLRMALQTREQHIKKEKATSNICTSQVLTAIIASMYVIFHGKKGLMKISTRIHNNVKKLEFFLTKNLRIKQLNKFYFDTLRIKTDYNNIIIKNISDKYNINFRYINKNNLTITLDETSSEKDIINILSIFLKSEKKNDVLYSKPILVNKIPYNLKRKSSFLNQKIFHSYTSENEFIRYISKLEKKDISLTTSMIPLGSCTMKLTPTTTLTAISDIYWQNIHPFVPNYQSLGYNFIIKHLGKYLKEITGFDGISFQPNSGAQGEYAGLITIKKYYNFNKIYNRNITFIPYSSHGTNFASASIAGMKIISINTKCDGTIDIKDLEKKSKMYSKNLSTLMITYPSTNGIYEPNIKKIIDIIHMYGGQVYMDGANMNAQVGLIKPSDIGFDICHLNLHKTFAIPHGGGGPGMGPICVKSHLIKFLPNHPHTNKKNKNEIIHTISSAPYGSPMILTISYAYILLLGNKGLSRCTEISILNANYIKEKLKKYYKILFLGINNMVAHELVLDFREFKSLDINVIDIAKRMMDYGFHAPTVSFPVEGCIMIEPTESESKHEIDYFIDMMIQIKKEINEIEQGKFSKQNNVIKNAPHSFDTLTNDNWDYPYSRKKAGFPLDWVKNRKFWIPVNRVNEGYGDRNLICNCV